MAALIEERGPVVAFKTLGKMLCSEPASSTEEELGCLMRATVLASQYGKVDLARKWTEAHRALRKQEGSFSRSDVESYKLIRVAFELAEKNYALVNTILENVDWGEIPKGTWVTDIQLLIAGWRDKREEIIDLLRRPSSQAQLTKSCASSSPCDRANRLRILGNYFLRRANRKRAVRCFQAALRNYSKVAGIDARLKTIELKGSWGTAERLDGHGQEAETLLESAIEGAVRFKHFHYEYTYKLSLATLHADRGRLESAEELALSVLRKSRSTNRDSAFLRYHRVRALMLIAHFALDASNGKRATSSLKRAKQALGEWDHAQLKGHLHLAQGRLYALGKSAGAAQRALQEFNRAESCFLTSGDGEANGVARAKIYRAQIHLRQRNVQEALTQLSAGDKLIKEKVLTEAHADSLLLKSRILLEQDAPDADQFYEDVLGSLGSVHSPVKLFKIVSNLYLYSWELDNQLDLTDYHLRQINKMSEVLDRPVFENLYQRHVTRRVAWRALVQTFGVDAAGLSDDDL